jgi:hypothetical protein
VFKILGKIWDGVLWLEVSTEFMLDSVIRQVNKMLEPKAICGFNLHFVSGQVTVLPRTTICAMMVDRLAEGTGVVAEARVLKFGTSLVIRK